MTPSLCWIDTHCHLDAPQFGAAVADIRAHATRNHVVMCVLPAVDVASFDTVRQQAHASCDSYCLGIHPLYVAKAQDDDLSRLDAALAQHQGDPRLVAVGEIGLDYFVPELCKRPLRERQEYFFVAQLKLARKYHLPVVLHSRRAVDQVLKGLRAVRGASSDVDPMAWRGIAHAFNGSAQQAQNMIALGLKLGFGGAFTYERALQLRRLAVELPLDALVMETDAPDMPPHWLYVTAQQRAAGEPAAVNSPAELPRMGAALAALRGVGVDELAKAVLANSVAALPGLAALLVQDGG